MGGEDEVKVVNGRKVQKIWGDYIYEFIVRQPKKYQTV